MLPKRSWGSFAAATRFICCLEADIPRSSAAVEPYGVIHGRGKRGVWASVISASSREEYSCGIPTAPPAAAATAAAATAAADVKESKWAFQQHLGRSVQVRRSLQGPSSLQCCCLSSTVILRPPCAAAAASLSSFNSCAASKRNKNLYWGQGGVGIGGRQERLLQGIAAVADTPHIHAKAMPPRSSSSSSSRSGSSSSSRGNAAFEFGEVYGPRAREAAAAAVAKGSSGGGVSAAAAAAPAAPTGAAAEGRPSLLSATPAAVQQIKRLIKNYNKALQQQQQQPGAEPPPKATGIRISLQRQGCSGMAYDVSLCTEQRADPTAAAAANAGGSAAAAPLHAPGAPGVASRRRKDWGRDEVVLIDGVEIRVAADAVMLLIGTQVDFVDEDVQTGFIFNNPNQKQSCGCGKSFMV